MPKSLPFGADKRLMITAGRASRQLGASIADKMGVELTNAGLKTFSDGEVYCRYEDSIRGADLFIVQSIAGHPELLGPDVTAAHLLLKNRVAERIGRSAYALFTEPAAAHLEVPLDGAVAIEEEYEHYPTIRGIVLTLS